jgi:ATP-dependent RNA helicase DDX42
LFRLGRTGRAGEKGLAYTLMTPKDKEFAPHLVRNLESADQDVCQELIDLASQVIYLFIYSKSFDFETLP